MNLTVIANNSMEAELLNNFRRLGVREQKFAVGFMREFSKNQPAATPPKKTHLHIVPTSRKAKK